MKEGENHMASGNGDRRSLTAYELWYGRDEPPPDRTSLRAGPLSALWEGGDLRGVRLADVEILRRVYVSARDENWDTIPARLTNLSADVRNDRFIITYDAETSSRNLELRWHAVLAGASDGTITLSMDGQAIRDFRYCRIGFCLLHPLAEYCGQPYTGIGPDVPISGNLPTCVAPQRYEGGFYLPLFPSVSSFTVSLKNGIEANFAFEGDLFEMEDQRNWTDGSFKTYCTPLSLGYPFQAHAGQSFKQRVTLTVQGRPAQGTARSSTVQLHVGPSLGRPLPQIGLGVASHEDALSSHDAEMLGRLRLDHLRADLHLAKDGDGWQLARAERECSMLNCGLELALFVTDDADRQLHSLASRFPLAVPISRVLVFHETEPTTAAKWVAIARRALLPRIPDVPICGGTNLNFAEINRFRPEISELDGVAYSINPQVHSFDERSLVENLEGQRDTVISAQAFCGKQSIIVSPITLKPRFNPDAIGPEAPPLPGELPTAVDARQMSLFAAAWTVGSIKQLVEAGASSLTFYETTGWRGLKETDGGCPLPDVFRSFPDMVFPVYHVFADVADLRDKELVTCNSSDPLRIQALAVQTGESLHMLVANLTDEPQQCAIAPVGAGRALVRTLDASRALQAMTHAEKFRFEAKVEIPVTDSALAIILQPYSTLRIDCAWG
jgi:hypothetical protein